MRRFLVVDAILATDEWQYEPVYLDDVNKFSRMDLEHLYHVRSVLRLFSETGSTLNLKKCHLLTGAVDYFGNFIRTAKQ